MSSYKEVVERANAALDQASARCQTREAEILRQRAAALDVVAPARQAITKHNAAIVKAANEFTLTKAKADAERDSGEQQANEALRQAEDEALLAWRTGDDEALAAWRSAVEAADRAYDEARRSGTIGSVNVADRLRVVHDNAISAAGRTYEQAKEANYDKYRQALADADQTQRKAVSRVRAKAEEALAVAGAVRDAAIDAAGAALGAALSADPAAASVVATFDRALETARRDCEQEKSAIIDQMRKDLSA